MAVSKKRSKHRMRRMKLIISFLVIIFLLAAGLLIFFQKKQVPVGKKVSVASDGLEEQDSISYNGKRYRYNDHLSNFVFMGVDHREQIETELGQADAGQADAIFLVSWDRVENSLKLFSIPRDTMTDIEVYTTAKQDLGRQKNHICIAYGYGDGKHDSCKLVCAAVSWLFHDLPIQGYCSMSLDGIPVLTDAVGGVTVTVPDDSLQERYPEFEESKEVVLTGENVEAFVRSRDIEKRQSALTRLNRQNIFLQAYSEKAAGIIEQDSSFVTELYDRLEDYLVTNMGNDLFAKISQSLAEGGSRESFTIPGEGVQGEIYDEYHVNEEELYSMIINNFYKEIQ